MNRGPLERYSVPAYAFGATLVAVAESHVGFPLAPYVNHVAKMLGVKL